MIKCITPLFCILLCLLGVDSNAQQYTSSEEFKGCELCDKQEDHQHRGPYFVSLKNEVPYIIANAGIFGAGLVFLATNKKDPFTLEELALLDRNNVNSFDRGATFNDSKSARSTSDLLFYAGSFLPYLAFLIDNNTRSDILPLFVMSAEAFLISGGLNLNAKHIFNRARPYAYNPSFSIETRTNASSRLSFFSGHASQTATATFFLAKVLSDYHPDMKSGWKVGMWSAAVAIPAVTGYLRIESGRHYNSDVIVGFSIGAAVGWLVPHLNKKKKQSKLSFKPYSNSGANGLSLVLRV